MLPYYRPGFLLACACWQFCKGQILSCWAAAALLFTIWSPHHTLKWDFVLIESQTSDSSDIIKIEHPLQRITCSETQRDAGEPSSHINISQHVWWLCVMQQGCACVCAQQSACLHGYMSEFSAWPFPSVCLLGVCVNSFWGWCWPTCLSGLSARTKFRSPPARLWKMGEGENTVTHPSRRWNTFLPLSVCLPLPPCLLIGIIELIFSRAALFLCQAQLFFFHFQLKTQCRVVFLLLRVWVCWCPKWH